MFLRRVESSESLRSWCLAVAAAAVVVVAAVAANVFAVVAAVAALGRAHPAQTMDAHRRLQSTFVMDDVVQHNWS